MGGAADEPVVAEIEEAFVAHWSLLGEWPGPGSWTTTCLLTFFAPAPIWPGKH